MFFQFHGSRSSNGGGGGPPTPQPTGERFAATAAGTETDYLRIAEANFDLETNRWHGFVWLYFEPLPESPAQVLCLNQFSDVAEDSAWTMGLAIDENGVKLSLAIQHDVSGSPTIEVVTAESWYSEHGDIVSGQWYFVDFWFDADDGSLGIRVNGGDSDTTILTGTSVVGPSALDLQTFWWSGPSGDPIVAMHGRLGGTGIRRGSLWSDEEIVYLFNVGCQILYGEVDAGTYTTIFDDLYGWWDMQENGGVDRVNAEGTASRDFLQVGTVGQSCGTCWDCGGG